MDILSIVLNCWLILTNAHILFNTTMCKHKNIEFTQTTTRNTIQKKILTKACNISNNSLYSVDYKTIIILNFLIRILSYIAYFIFTFTFKSIMNLLISVWFKPFTTLVATFHFFCFFTILLATLFIHTTPFLAFLFLISILVLTTFLIISQMDIEEFNWLFCSAVTWLSNGTLLFPFDFLSTLPLSFSQFSLEHPAIILLASSNNFLLVFLYMLTQSDLCPVISLITCSDTDDWYILDAEVALNEWFMNFPLIPAISQIVLTVLPTLFLP